MVPFRQRQGLGQIVCGFLLSPLGQTEQALQEALTLCRSMATPYAEAKTFYTAGLVSRKRREFEPARQRLEEALGICTRLGERLYAQHIEQLLGQTNTSEQDFTLQSSKQLDSRRA